MKFASHKACSAFSTSVRFLTYIHSLQTTNSIFTGLHSRLEFVWAFLKLQLSLYSWHSALFSHHTHKSSPLLNNHTTENPQCSAGMIFTYSAKEVSCQCIWGAADSQSAAGRSKVHIRVLPTVQVGLIRCYGNSCYKGSFVPEGQAQFLWH